MKKRRDKYSPLIYWLTKRISYIMGRIQQNLRYFCPPEVKKLKAPFIVCSNHVGLWDPFFLCHPFRNGLRYITSDAAFRSKAKGWLLGKLGCVPKTKGVRDSETIRFLFEVIGKRQCIGLFPEGDRSYEGRTMALDSATGKLLKKAGVPVVAAVHRGTSFSHPRWSDRPNKGRVEYHYRLLFTPETLTALDADTIQRQLEEALAHDDTRWQEEMRIPFAGGHRAMHIEHPLFLCPACRAIATIRSAGDHFACTACGKAWHVDHFGFFRSSGEVHHANLRDWIDWQKEELGRLFAAAGAEGEVFRDDGCTLLSGFKSEPLVEEGQGSAVLTGSGVRFLPANGGEPRFFPAAAMRGITVLEGETPEFYCGEHCYQLRFAGFVSACKWVTALLQLQR